MYRNIIIFTLTALSMLLISACTPKTKCFDIATLNTPEEVVQVTTTCINTGELSLTEQVKAHLNRGHSYLRLKEYKLAIQDYDKLLQLDPTFTTICTERGLAKMLLGEYGDAILDFNTAISTNPNDVDALKLRATIYKFLGRTDEARADLDRANAIGPQTVIKINIPDPQRMGLGY